MRKKYILFALIVAILSLVSCNLDNEGILSRLPHVNRIDHKDRVFIGTKEDVFYFVSKDGLQEGNASKNETTILDDAILEKFYLGLGWMTDDAIIYMTDGQPNVSVNEQKFYYVPLSTPTEFKEITPECDNSEKFVVIACYQIGTETYLVTKESQSSNNATIYKAEATGTTLKLSELSDAKTVENFADCINGLIRTADNKYYLNGTEVKFKDKEGKYVSVGSSIKSVTYSDSDVPSDIYVITSGFTVYKGSVSNPAEMMYVADATGSSTSIFPSFVDSDGNLYFIEYMGERSPSRILTLSTDSADNTKSKFSIRNTQSNDIEASEIFKLGEEVYVLTTQYGLFSLDDV